MELTADIVINGKYIARLQMEGGKDKMILEFFEASTFHKIDAIVFIEAVSEARTLLLK